MFVQQYSDAVFRVLHEVFDQETEKIEKAGAMLADTLQNDGLLHVFGCGHSHIVEEELFFRAGGLAAANAIFETSVMLHEGASKSSRIERMSGYAPLVLEGYPIASGDCFLIVSSSGINPFPIEMAQEAKRRGAKVIGISSFLYLEKPSREANGLHLPDVCDLCIDNHVPVGDATIEVRRDGTRAGPVSSLASVCIANSVVLAACDRLRERGIEPEVYKSGNCEGSDAHNADLIRRFRARIRHL